MSHHRGPEQPPIPHPERYELSWRAAHPGRTRRAIRRVDRWCTDHVAAVVTVVGVCIVAVGVVIVANDSPARAAGDKAAVVSRGPEYAPPVPGRVSGDGMWIVGKQIKPGVYQSNAGVSCYWERLAGLSGKYEDLLDNGGFRRGPKLVEVKATDFAFASQGCGEWVMVP